MGLVGKWDEMRSSLVAVTRKLARLAVGPNPEDKTVSLLHIAVLAASGAEARNDPLGGPGLSKCSGKCRLRLACARCQKQSPNPCAIIGFAKETCQRVS